LGGAEPVLHPTMKSTPIAASATERFTRSRGCEKAESLDVLLKAHLDVEASSRYDPPPGSEPRRSVHRFDLDARRDRARFVAKTREE
jgi:hypothetical protein